MNSPIHRTRLTKKMDRFSRLDAIVILSAVCLFWSPPLITLLYFVHQFHPQISNYNLFRTCLKLSVSRALKQNPLAKSHKLFKTLKALQYFAWKNSSAPLTKSTLSIQKFRVTRTPYAHLFVRLIIDEHTLEPQFTVLDQSLSPTRSVVFVRTWASLDSCNFDTATLKRALGLDFSLNLCRVLSCILIFANYLLSYSLKKTLSERSRGECGEIYRNLFLFNELLFSTVYSVMIIIIIIIVVVIVIFNYGV